MLRRFSRIRQEYPRQFWLLFWGLLISTIGASMIWPFLMIYVSERLDLPLTAVASLITLNAFVGLIFSFIAGPVTDRLGRKWVMVISLAVNGLGYILMSQAHTLTHFALLMALSGAFNPLYKVGADAMMADLIPAEKRIDAYALLRMIHNVGVALGPAIGGTLAVISYSIIFFCAAGGLIIYSLLIAFLARETLPEIARQPGRPAERFGGYGRILRDWPFMSFNFLFTLTQVCAALIWVLMAVYAKQNYGVLESLYGWIPTTNAVMVVLFQVWVTQRTKRYSPLAALSLGTLFYAVATGSVAFNTAFWGFWISMVILTIGELILSPVATTLAANMAPAEMRGRYMSIHGLTWGIASGIGPVLGGVLNDSIGPSAIWYGGALIGLVSAVGFLVLMRRFPLSLNAVGD